MVYLRRMSSLEESASTQVAINLCQENGFKEVAMRLERPTYGAFVYEGRDTPVFITGPEKSPTWAKVKGYDLLLFSHIEQWDAAVDEQCQRLTVGIPSVLKQGIHAWINRIALEYLSYSRRQEVLFEVSRYFLMDFLTLGDWTNTGRLDEKKLAERLLKDERLTVWQRYRIACVYCLHGNIPRLWMGLTQEEKLLLTRRHDYHHKDDIHHLVSLWSYQMNRHRKLKLTRWKNHVWTELMEQAVNYGNRATLMSCWKELKESVRHQMIIRIALQILKQWRRVQNIWNEKRKWTLKLVSNKLPCNQGFEVLSAFNLPSHYSDLVQFFLSQMDEERQLTFFKQAFESQEAYILECFLEWPLQDDFLPTINRLWGIVPKDVYGHCLLTLGRKYSGNSFTWIDKKENSYYDYRSMLWTLWEDTPEEYRRYLFRDKKPNGVTSFLLVNIGNQFLSLLLDRSPFQEKDEALFKRVCCDQPQEVRRAIMLSEVGERICLSFTQNEKLSFMNWLLEECLPKEEIPSFKKQFIHLYRARRLCCSKLADNRERFVEDLMDWCFELDTEKAQYRYALVTENDNYCGYLLCKGEFAKVERVINFCVPSGEKKEPFKVRFAHEACGALVQNCEWEQMDTILAWIDADAEAKTRDLKKDLFSFKGIRVHCNLVFIRRKWEEVERFYKWFDLSPEEIKKLKRDTVFIPEVIEDIGEKLRVHTDTLVAPLHWCLTDEEMVIDLKKELEQYFKQPVFIGRIKKEWLDCFVRELLYVVRRKEEVRDRTCEGGVFVKDKGEKRSVATEDESSSANKRFNT